MPTASFERSAVIACHVDGDRVEIVNVVYGGRNVEALFEGPDEEDGAN